MNKQELNWDDDDDVLQRENADIIELLSRQAVVEPSAKLDRSIRLLAKSNANDTITSHWIFGQGPLVILVTCILFAVAVMYLSR